MRTIFTRDNSITNLTETILYMEEANYAFYGMKFSKFD